MYFVEVRRDSSRECKTRAGAGGVASEVGMVTACPGPKCEQHDTVGAGADTSSESCGRLAAAEIGVVLPGNI